MRHHRCRRHHPLPKKEEKKGKKKKRESPLNADSHLSYNVRFPALASIMKMLSFYHVLQYHMFEVLHCLISREKPSFPWT